MGCTTPEAFHASASKFDVTVGLNRFTGSGVHLDLPQLSGDIEYSTALDP